MSFSIVHYYGKHESRCGYCKGQKCSTAHGMHAYQLSPQDYQDLIDRGWRRSGHYCYKPHMSTTCCPCYTIKCDALEFKLSKSHKKILKRVNRFLRDGKKDANDETSVAKSADEAGGHSNSTEPQVPDANIPKVNIAAISNDANKMRRTQDIHVQQTDVAANPTNDLLPNEPTSNSVPDATKKPCKKSKQMRLERRQVKLLAKGINIDTQATAVKAAKNKEKTLQDYLSEPGPNDKHTLKIVLVHSNKLIITDEAYNLYRKYQINIHNDKPDSLTLTNLERFLYKSPLKLVLVQVASKQFDKTLSSTYKLYQKYQTIIHNDPPKNVKEYLEFLQSTPLKLNKSADGPESGYGSFHQQYWLDDMLIAVGVIDILPYCVSSVYFFYDPDYSFLTLGTYGSLREIAFVQELAEKVPLIRHYYMGFYVHSCPKMRYKGKLVPSYLLCPETYTWHLLTESILSRLDANKYQRLNIDVFAKDVDEFATSHLDGVLLLVDNNKFIRYREYIQITGDADDREYVLEYGKLVGQACAQRLIYLKDD